MHILWDITYEMTGSEHHGRRPQDTGNGIVRQNKLYPKMPQSPTPIQGILELAPPRNTKHINNVIIASKHGFDIILTH